MTQIGSSKSVAQNLQHIIDCPKPPAQKHYLKIFSSKSETQYQKQKLGSSKSAAQIQQRKDSSSKSVAQNP